MCPAWRVALLRPRHPITMLDLTAEGCAMAIGALPALADGPYPRALTQQWARAIYEDDPTGAHVSGVRYSSAYNGGVALALWDSAGHVDVVRNSQSVEQDFALAHPEMLDRLEAALSLRRVTVRLITSAQCPRCP